MVESLYKEPGWGFGICPCHAHSQGHWFDEENICDGCSIGWHTHQLNPKPCPSATAHARNKYAHRVKNKRVESPYRIYWNSHRKNWTLTHRQLKVLAFEYALARNTTFIISEVVQAKALTAKRRNVHAWVQMKKEDLQIVTAPETKYIIPSNAIVYNVFRSKVFTDINEHPVPLTTDKIYFHTDGTMYATV